MKLCNEYGELTLTVEEYQELTKLKLSKRPYTKKAKVKTHKTGYKASRWTLAQDNFIKKYAPIKTNKQLRNMVNKKFGTKRTVAAIATHKWELKTWEKQ